MKTDANAIIIAVVFLVLGGVLVLLFYPIDIVKCEGEPTGWHICYEYANGTKECGIDIIGSVNIFGKPQSIIFSGTERRENVVAMYLTLGVSNVGNRTLTITKIEYTGPWANSFDTFPQTTIPIAGSTSHASNRIDVSNGVGGEYGAYDICANVTWISGAYSGSSMECKSISVLQDPTLGVNLGWGPI